MKTSKRQWHETSPLLQNPSTMG